MSTHTRKSKKTKTEAALRLGNHIRSLRTGRKLSQADLAATADISAKYLGEIERGEGNISVELLTKIASGLGLQLKDIVDAEHERPLPEIVAEIIRLAPRLSEKDARMAYRMLKMLTNE